MSANVETMMYVGETPWHGLGTRYEIAPKSCEDIIQGANLDWTVSLHELSSDIEPNMIDWWGVYRNDTNYRIGCVNRRNPVVVQNEHTFYSMESQLGKSVEVETAASLGQGEKVFGCFKMKNDAKILDDEIETYFVLLNDHKVADGRVTALITPIRVVCENTLSYALSKATTKVRIPITEDVAINNEIINKLFAQSEQAIKSLNAVAKDWVGKSVSREQMKIIMDELFPYPNPEDQFDEKNTKMDIKRTTFLENCMSADNLNNYRGTVYQVFNALTDYATHYFANPDKAFDLKYRMSMIPGMGTESDTPVSAVSKFMKMQKKMFA